MVYEAKIERLQKRIAELEDLDRYRTALETIRLACEGVCSDWLVVIERIDRTASTALGIGEARR